MSKAQLPKTPTDKQIKNARLMKKAYGVVRNSATGNVSAISSSIGSTGGSTGNASTTTSSSSYLKTAGDTMMGPIAFSQQVGTVTAGVLDISSTTNAYRSYVVVSGNTTINTISGAAFSGQLLFLEAVATYTVTLTTAGNITTNTGSSITITNTNIAILIFDAIQNKWQVISNGSSSGGDNLGNHTATTDLKLENNKIYFNTGLTKYIQNDNSLGINYVTPSSTSHWFHIGGVGSYTFGITTGGVSTQVPILMNNHYLEGVDYIDFNSSGSIQKIDTSADGKVFNFYTNNTQRLNISENSLLNGTLELYGAGGTGSQASASFKTVSTQTATTNLYIGDFVFDGKNNLGVQKTYADIIAQSVDTTSGSEDGAILFNVITAGTLSNRLTLNSSGLANAGTFSSLGYVTFYGGGYLGGTFSADIITGIDYLTFGVTSGNSPKIDVSTNGKVINFYTNTQTTSRVNISENTLLNGTLELYGAGGTVGQASASFKTVSTQTAATNLYIGDFVFDGKNSSGVQTTYADIIAQSATTTAGAENGAILFNIKTAGTLTNRLTLNSSGLTNAGTFSSIGSATFSSYLIAAGGLRASVFTVASGTYAVDPTDVTVVSTNTSGTVTLNLPSASTNAGAFYIFYKRNAGGSTVINRAGSDLIDGATSYSLINQFQTVLMQSDGAAKWMVLSSG